ncbi:lipocalin-like domain-containing protein [Fulvivirgaceae bacterium BMA10]|uniref:Lipocalin-like domain-containing protein n=1 Tax=Splendidivirga corallicola TaxID=3051826 RepID=A0ABT8KJK1_9BACT|nr:lipocalin-like domain-containing protein [Fulvivirgaceae bacterium BMA10]
MLLKSHQLQQILISVVLLVFLSACRIQMNTSYDVWTDQAAVLKDEAPHFKNSIEWWYFTGHLTELNTDREYGVEYVFFHINPKGKKDYMMAHFAVSDPNNNSFIYDYQFEGLKDNLRADLPLQLRIEKRNRTWQLTGQEGVYHLSAEMVKPKGFAIDLRTVPSKPVLMHDGNGYFNYEDFGSAGYYSYTRLSTSGILTLNGVKKNVKGELWYDRQWNGGNVAQKDMAWDWMAIQFDGSQDELMIGILYNHKTGKQFVAGTFFDSNSKNTHLKQADIRIKELAYWKSKESKAEYPIKWNVKVPRFGYDLIVEAVIRHQELKLSLAPFHRMFYWEGKCKVYGTRNGQPVTGKSYAEITNRK